MSNKIITHHILDAPGEVIEDLQHSAPRGWATWHMIASTSKEKPPPVPKRRRRGKAPKPDPYSEFEKIMSAARAEKDSNCAVRKYWESGQVKRRYEPMSPRETDKLPYLWDRDDQRNFASVPALLMELRKKIPEATGFLVLWIIHPPYLEEDLRRDNEPIRAPERHGKGDAEKLFREYVRQALRDDPSWLPDYAILAPLFPDLAPRYRPDGAPIKDRTFLLRLIVSEERKTLGLKAPPPPKSARARLLELFEAGVDRDHAAATIKLEGYDVASSYVSAVHAEWRRSQLLPAPPVEPIEYGAVKVPIGTPVEVVVEPGAGPVEITAPPGVVIVHRPSPRAEPVRVREARPVAEEASPESYARELLRRGATYDEVRRTLLEERGRIVPDGTLRRLATELRKADVAVPLSEARSRSDVARALIRDGLSYDQIEAAFAAKGEKPLSRGQLRAIKANLKG